MQHSLVISDGNIPGAMLRRRNRQHSSLGSDGSGGGPAYLFTRTLTALRRSSCARSLVRWMSAALLTLYMKWCCVVRVMPDIDEVLITEPVWFGRSMDAAASKGMKATVVK